MHVNLMWHDVLTGVTWEDGDQEVGASHPRIKALELDVCDNVLNLDDV
jgi:hypothetical protein